jgi:PBSX family phage terminase large subunit
MHNMMELSVSPEFYGEVNDGHRLFEPRGAARDLLYCRAPQVLIEGPAGTGKSRAALEKILLCMDLFPGIRVLTARKTRKSLTQSTMVTWERKVIPAGALGKGKTIEWRTQEQEYRHMNGSIMAVGGMDDPDKIMSSEYDIIYFPEATELEEDDWEKGTTRLRNNVLHFQQLLGDCNPQNPKHWLNVRCNEGKTVRLRSRHKDNPEYFDEKTGQWTEKGKAYLAGLKQLSGVRFWRLYKGIWRQAEGLVFEQWDERIHRRMPRAVPREWRRVWSIDFGYNSPFVFQDWAIDHDGRMWLVQQIYMTKRRVSQHAADILAITTGQPRPIAIVADHDADGRAELEHRLKRKITPAYKKNILEGIEAVQDRLVPSGDGIPRLLFMRDNLYQRDAQLDELHLPACTEDEFEAYVWGDKRKKDVPVDEYNHGMDAMRYAVAYVDKLGEQRKRGVRQTSLAA